MGVQIHTTSNQIHTTSNFHFFFVIEAPKYRNKWGTTFTKFHKQHFSHLSKFKRGSITMQVMQRVSKFLNNRAYHAVKLDDIKAYYQKNSNLNPSIQEE
jgi:hypothetical protein